METKLRKGIAQVLFANIINLLISLFNGFIIPKYLSIPTYANYKTFQLYISYVGVLHFGFVDGIYINYGGKKLNHISKEDFSLAQKSLLLFQLFITIIGILIAPFVRDFYLLIAILCVMPTNMQVFYKSVFQATGEFGLYRRILNAQSLTIFSFNMIALLLMHNDNAKVYATGFLFISVIVWLIFVYNLRGIFVKTQTKIYDVWNSLKKHIGLGAIIMMGNFMSIWITSIDRWFVKFHCTEDKFAYYSFAVSILKLVNVIFSAFSVALYNYFCVNNEQSRIRDIRRKILIVASMVISCSFIIKRIVESFLKDYIPAENVMMFLISSQLFAVVINAIYLNLYKALNLQKRYLRLMIETSVVAVIANYIFGLIFDFSMESFSYATFMTMLIWMWRCQTDLKEYRLDLREWIYIIIVYGSFFMFKRLPSLFGFVGYILSLLAVSVMLFRIEIKDIFFQSVSVINRGKEK